MNKIIKWLKAYWILREEILCGSPCWIIYYKQFGLLLFLERWNTLESAQKRLKELNKNLTEGKILHEQSMDADKNRANA